MLSHKPEKETKIQFYLNFLPQTIAWKFKVGKTKEKEKYTPQGGKLIVEEKNIPLMLIFFS